MLKYSENKKIYFIIIPFYIIFRIILFLIKKNK
jgi:hypothetical protein